MILFMPQVKKLKKKVRVILEITFSPGHCALNIILE